MDRLMSGSFYTNLRNGREHAELPELQKSIASSLPEHISCKRKVKIRFLNRNKSRSCSAVLRSVHNPSALEVASSGLPAGYTELLV